jgi:hypothetical protein
MKKLTSQSDAKSEDFTPQFATTTIKVLKSKFDWCHSIFIVSEDAWASWNKEYCKSLDLEPGHHYHADLMTKEYKGKTEWKATRIHCCLTLNKDKKK